MAAPTEAQLAHQKLLEELDTHAIQKTFRSATWKPNQRRNKNLKAILGDASKREASAVATPADHSGAATPARDDGLSTSGTSTPATTTGNSGGSGSLTAAPNLAQASSSLSKLVLEKSLKPSGLAAASGGGTTPAATYMNIESAPSLAHAKRYCDITGLPAPYFDPKSRLRYHNKEVFALIRSLPQSTAELYLEARGAHTILK
ncbi:YL1 nuclear [Cordyceps militaris CM01]|uniref:YL1 nuclear n=2 Tax=Cordyceps militaris TaxID=73501 RepID=G3JE63_CORMM|nr:YL1 nuclear [Cordyceps militaris CM01]ATY65167.1 YL1 nuclear [Cordyceps militaris]EGX92888.1 YL1 nuclear [Cordyceps militaris CM01]